MLELISHLPAQTAISSHMDLKVIESEDIPFCNECRTIYSAPIEHASAETRSMIMSAQWEISFGHAAHRDGIQHHWCDSHYEREAAFSRTNYQSQLASVWRDIFENRTSNGTENNHPQPTIPLANYEAFSKAVDGQLSRTASTTLGESFPADTNFIDSVLPEASEWEVDTMYDMLEAGEVYRDEMLDRRKSYRTQVFRLKDGREETASVPQARGSARRSSL